MNIEVYGSAFNASLRHSHGYDGPIQIDDLRDLILGELTWEYEDEPEEECYWYVIYEEQEFNFYSNESFQSFLKDIFQREGVRLHHA